MKYLLCVFLWFVVSFEVEADEDVLSINGDILFKDFCGKIKKDILDGKDSEINIIIKKSEDKTFAFNYQPPLSDGHKKNPWHGAYFKLHGSNKSISGNHVLNGFSIYFFDIDTNKRPDIIQKLEKASDVFRSSKNFKFCIALRIDDDIEMEHVAEAIEHIVPLCEGRFLLENKEDK